MLNINILYPNRHFVYIFTVSLFFSGLTDRERREDPFRMLRDADRFPVILREAGWSSAPASRLGEGERAPADILARLADGKHRIKEDEPKLFSYGKNTYYKKFSIRRIIYAAKCFRLNSI